MPIGDQDKPGKPWEVHPEKMTGGGPVYAHGYPGMSLRDWFAGMAMNGMISNTDTAGKLYYDNMARMSYHMADAMLKAREKKDV